MHLKPSYSLTPDCNMVTFITQNSMTNLRVTLQLTYSVLALTAYSPYTTVFPRYNALSTLYSVLRVHACQRPTLTMLNLHLFSVEIH